MLTNWIVGGRIAIVADNSRLDLAGVTLRGVERGVQTCAWSHLLFCQRIQRTRVPRECTFFVASRIRERIHTMSSSDSPIEH